MSTSPARQRTVAIVQARMTSTRLPGKVLAPVCGKPLLGHLVARLSLATRLDAIVIATTGNGTDDPIATLAHDLGIACFRGSETDVLSRYQGAARQAGAGTVVRITGDCPLIDPAVVDRVINVFAESGADYASNTITRSYPIGMDTEVFRTTALDAAARDATLPEEREHVTPFLYRNPNRFSLCDVAAPAHQRRPELRLTVDTAVDLDLVTRILDTLHPVDPAFDLSAVLALLDANPAWSDINAHVPHRWLNSR